MQKLLFLLPFYVIRYEKSREDIEKDPEKLQKLLDEYVTISRRLEESLLENGKEALHRYLVEVIIKIADYIFSDSEKTKKGVDRAMGGEVLELKTDKLINEIRQDVKEEVKAEMKKEGTDHVWLSMENIDKDTILNHFPNIYQRCLEEGYDVTKECIPVVPAQHYFMGGIWVDSDSKTSMDQLYAVGETSCNGVHGANRLASNSLLESLVFAKRAAKAISAEKKSTAGAA